jgi:hypothetical protein
MKVYLNLWLCPFNSPRITTYTYQIKLKYIHLRTIIWGRWARTITKLFCIFLERDVCMRIIFITHDNVTLFGTSTLSPTTTYKYVSLEATLLHGHRLP